MITFKRDRKPTGLASIGSPDPDVSIKLRGCVFGYIKPPTWRTNDNKWSIMIAVEKEDLTNDKNPNCSWRWMTYKKRFNEEEEARAFVKKHEKAILSLKLHLFERE